MPISSVLKRIDETRFLFQLVVNSNRRLLGTVTDGDIRRSMLKGFGLDAPATSCMFPNPRTGTINEDRANAGKLESIGTTRPFLPILDANRQVVEILVRAGPEAGISHAVVMAGGYGRRLGERTLQVPKPLLAVGGRPILDRAIGALEDAGVSQIIISIHYLGDQIRQFVDSRENRAVISLVEEAEPLGTAGALGLLEDVGNRPFLVVNADVLTNCDFTALNEFHVRHGHDATIGVARYDVQVPYGVVRHSEDGAFSGIEEKPVLSNFIAAGVYFLAPEFTALIPSGRPIDMPELLNAGRKVGLKIGVFPIHEYWTDLGDPKDLDAANKKFISDR